MVRPFVGPGWNCSMSAPSRVKIETKEEQDETVPETVDVEDVVDRAMRKRKLGDNARIDLDRIGFWPDNKDGIGVSSRHIHEIAEDIMNNKTRFNRHSPAELLELPEPLLKKTEDKTKRNATTILSCHATPPTWSMYQLLKIIAFMFANSSKTATTLCSTRQRGSQSVINRPIPRALKY